MGMFPHEKALVKRHAADPFALVGVNTDGDKDSFRKNVEKHGITWRSSWQGSTAGPICKQFRVTGYPTLFLIDHEGVIRHKWLGSPGDEAMDKAIEALVAKAKGG